MSDAWRNVNRDGVPPCDGHTVFIGINSAGYACCFNAMQSGTCVMETAEGAYRQMSDLRDWRLLDRPTRSAGAAVTPDCNCPGDGSPWPRFHAPNCPYRANHVSAKGLPE